MIGVAVIGVGNALVPHAKSLTELEHRVRVVWTVASSEKRLGRIATTYGWPVTTDAARAVSDPDVQAVLLLTPPNAHLELAEAAFGAGKHVLCEKPLEVSLERAERLVAAGRRANRILSVVLQMRFRPGSQKLRRQLESGALGEVQAATMSVPWWRPQSYYDEPGRGTRARDGGGVLITQAIHTIDLFRWLVGVSKVEAAQAGRTALHRMECEDIASALVRLDNGSPGVIMATTAAYPGRAEWIDVVCERGVARLDGGNLRLDFLDGHVELLADEGGSGSGANVMGFSHEAHKAVLMDFLDAIETGRDPAITGDSALETQRLIEAILAKAEGR
jgi:predicted dehydrogenase